MLSSKILVVDDDENILELVSDELKRAEYQVLTARSGTEAIQMVKSLPPNLILMDVLLQDMDGGEAVRKIREDPQVPDIPVIFLTGMISQDEDEHTININGKLELAIAKPIDFKKLFEEIRRILKTGGQ